MAEPFIAEIRIFPYSFAPKDWAFCNGQVMPIAQNTALFSLLGTTFGGNGTTTFGLPNLQASCAVGAGAAPGASTYALGASGGATSVTLNATQGAPHAHTMRVINPFGGDTNANQP